MGADLLASWLEIPKEKEPDWKAGKAFIATLSDDQCLKAKCEAVQLGINDAEEEELTGSDCRTEIEKALANLKIAWEEGGHTYILIETSKGDRIFLTGDTSWGESVESTDEMTLLVTAGVTKVCGFIN